ncbi:cytochrome b/b6 domain-containing protein [Phenylobacterium sp.]|uniref:cytochrome b/b6 domain-containing protein n=1 Tax=Phenylobacterium sp. TaxID=1871053 RepID=UPI002C8915EF|nr:cytochrome b/b6 domain-containing protein [Phenylobacterium sp.]HVI34434.1 cytochrome b/b6 domain-containing protein [Phenylobacterium sp.]
MQNIQARRWDPLVRLTHWGVAAGVLANGAFTEEGSGLHLWVGYGVGALLALRLLWGFIGPAEARFSAFPPSPGRAAAHLREIAEGRRSHHRSHNPLGALMVYALWATLAVVIATGVAMAGPPTLSTPPAVAASNERGHEAAEAAEHEGGHEAHGSARDGDAEHEEDEWMEEVHEAAANLLFVLAALHILGVAFETRRSGRQILTAMIGGRRKAAPAE